MGFLDLFKSETPQQKMRKYKRGLDKTTRELDRERNKLVNQEKKIQMEMKQMARKGETDALRIMAKDLVRTRKNSQKMYLMRTNIQGISLHIQTMSSANQMTEAMKGVSKAMRSMNKQMKIPQMAKIMRDFEKESELMGMKDEMMGDAVDDALDTEGDDEDDTELEVQKTMDEVQLELQKQMHVNSAPVKPTKTPEADDDDIMKRLDAIRR
eukprot:gene8663-6089_t